MRRGAWFQAPLWGPGRRVGGGHHGDPRSPNHAPPPPLIFCNPPGSPSAHSFSLRPSAAGSSSSSVMAGGALDGKGRKWGKGGGYFFLGGGIPNLRAPPSGLFHPPAEPQEQPEAPQVPAVHQGQAQGDGGRCVGPHRWGGSRRTTRILGTPPGILGTPLPHSSPHFGMSPLSWFGSP